MKKPILLLFAILVFEAVNSQNYIFKANYNKCSIEDGIYKSLIRFSNVYNDLTESRRSAVNFRVFWVGVNDNIVTYIGRNKIDNYNSNLINVINPLSTPFIFCKESKKGKKYRSEIQYTVRSSNKLRKAEIKILNN